MGLLKTAVNSALVVSVLLDLFLDKTFMDNSADLSYWIQTNGGTATNAVAVFFSYPVTAAILGFMFFHQLATRKQLKSLYYFAVFGSSVCVGVLAKNVWYKGRPYAVRDGVKGTSCDPGMPSGHTIVSVAGCFVIYKALTEDKLPHSRLAKQIAGPTCVFTVLMVMASRIVLGDHSYNQVWMGGLIAGVFIVNLDYPTFLHLFERHGSRLQSHMALAQVISVVLLVVFSLVNHKYRENPGYWKYLSKNKECPDSFVQGSAIASPFICWIYSHAMFLAVREQPLKEKPREPQTWRHSLVRVAVYTGLALPAFAALGLVAVVQDQVTHYFAKNVCTIAVISAAASYLGFATARLSKTINTCLGVARAEDHLHLSDLATELNRLEALRHNESLGARQPAESADYTEASA